MPWRAETVVTTLTHLASYNPSRTTLTVVNNGSVTITISQDEGNIAAQGFPLTAGGGATLNRRQGDEPELALFAVADSGSQNVRIHEGLGDVDLPAAGTEATS